LSRANRVWMLLAVLFLTWAGVASAASLYYQQVSASFREMYNVEHQKYVEAQVKYQIAVGNYTSVLRELTNLRESTLHVRVLINYGNGTVETSDDVYLFKGANVLDALRAVADVEATYWEAYKAFLIDSINGVENNEGGNNRWWIYSVNGEHAHVSADQYILSEGDTIEWTYHQY